MDTNSKVGSVAIIVTVLVLLGLGGYFLLRSEEPAQEGEFNPTGRLYLTLTPLNEVGLSTGIPSIYKYDGGLEKFTGNNYFTSKFTSDGKRLVFVAPDPKDPLGPNQLFVSEKDKDRIQITSDSSRMKRTPEWSPDDSLVVYQANWGSKISPDSWITYVVDLEGNKKFSTYGAHPVFLPDNRLLVVRVSGFWLFDVNNPDDQGMHIWQPPAGEEFSTDVRPAVSKDGKYLVWTSLNKEMFIWKISSWNMPLKIKNPKMVSGHFSWPVFSPDGEYLAVIEHYIETAPKIVVYNIETLESRVEHELNDFDAENIYLTDWRSLSSKSLSSNFINVVLALEGETGGVGDTGDGDTGDGDTGDGDTGDGGYNYDDYYDDYNESGGFYNPSDFGVYDFSKSMSNGQKNVSFDSTTGNWVGEQSEGSQLPNPDGTACTPGQWNPVSNPKVFCSRCRSNGMWDYSCTDYGTFDDMGGEFCACQLQCEGSNSGQCVLPIVIDHQPRGSLDATDCDAGITGWAQDLDTPDIPIDVHIYLDGHATEPDAIGPFVVTANQYRADLCSAIGSCNHGFTLDIPSQYKDGNSHLVYVYGIDSEGGTNLGLAGIPKAFNCEVISEPPPVTPRGSLDVADCDAGITGWAQDLDTPDIPIDVHIYIGGSASSGAPGYSVSANQYRADLCGAIGSCEHAYVFDIPDQFKDGNTYSVYAYGIDSEGGTNSQLSGVPKNFTCAPPPKPPVGSLSSADCDYITGWAQDPDEPNKAIDIQIYFGGPAGIGEGYSMTTDNSHNFSFKVLSKFKDGKTYSVYAYGIDTQGGASAQLGDPKSITCSPQAVCVPGTSPGDSFYPGSPCTGCQ